jgi:hypothetical protein
MGMGLRSSRRPIGIATAATDWGAPHRNSESAGAPHLDSEMWVPAPRLSPGCPILGRFHRHRVEYSRPREPLSLYCTTSVSPTLRVSPALVPETSKLYVPLGVEIVDPPPPAVVNGINREAPHPAAPNKQQTIATRRQRLRPSPSSPSGNSPTSHIIGRDPGSPGNRIAAISVATVTDTVDVPPSAPATGVTTQVEYAGAPVHVNATIPDTPATEVSSSGYTACAPAEIVCVVLPFAANVKSIPIPVNCKLCGEVPALSTTVKLPARVPAAVGTNTICIEHAAPAARLTPHVLLPATNAKSPVAPML